MSKVEKASFVSSIHVYRVIHRMTQQELAEKVGVSRQTILQLEKNRYNPSLLLAFRIAKFFHVRVEDIFVVNES